MKAIIFIFLKIAEVSAVVFVPYWAGWFLHREASMFWRWGLGLADIGLCGCAVALSLVVFSFVPDFIKWNWRMSESVMEFFRKGE